MKGLVHIYTGDGKGKTTSAIGLATRAIGGGLKVCYISFLKNPDKYGYTEMDSLRQLGAKVINYAKGHPHLNKDITEESTRLQINQAIEQIQQMLTIEEYDLLIMDEILIAVRDSFLDEQTLENFIINKPQSLELVLTGRGATEKIKQHAHYISFIQKIKHPYDTGIMSRKGIEY